MGDSTSDGHNMQYHMKSYDRNKVQNKMNPKILKYSGHCMPTIRCIVTLALMQK